MTITKQNKKKADDSISNLYKDKDDKKEEVDKVPPRPDSGNLVFDSDEEDAWDKKYGDTHFRDGRPKPKKTSSSELPDKDKFIKELGAEKGYAAYRAAAIRKLSNIYAGKAEQVFNQMEKSGKA